MREDVFAVFTAVNNFLWSQIEARKLTRDELHKIRWQMIFDELEIRADGEAFEERFVEYLFNSCVPVEGAHSLLEYLSERYKVFAASNASLDQQKNRLGKADMLKYMSGLFVSGDIGFPKPSKEFFDACFERLGSPPRSEVILIGDSPAADIIGGHAFGITTCWLNRGGESAADVPADYTVSSLAQIKGIL